MEMSLKKRPEMNQQAADTYTLGSNVVVLRKQVVLYCIL